MDAPPPRPIQTTSAAACVERNEAQAVIKAYKVIDAAAVFMMKKRLPLRIMPLCKLTTSLAGMRPSLEINLFLLQTLCALIPEVLSLVYVPEIATEASAIHASEPLRVCVAETSYQLEIVYKKPYTGLSKSACGKREQLLKNSVSKCLTDVFPAASLPPLPGKKRKAATPKPRVESLAQDGINSTLMLREQYCSDSMDTRTLDVDGILAFLKDAPFYKNQLQALEASSRKAAQTCPLDKPLHPALQETIEFCFGATSFYRHQTISINAARSGHDVVVATSTSSGKSMIYNVPVFQSMLEAAQEQVGGLGGGFCLYGDEEPTTCGASALYIFPTKALAQDQLGASKRIADALADRSGVRVNVHTFDGDTPDDIRKQVRETSDIIITNPDMLHTTILPNHKDWSSFWNRLRYVVIDEAHTYNGAFGSHVAGVMKRFLRVAALYTERQPQFFSCSATIRNPESLFRNLVAGSINPCKVVGEELNGSPSGRHVLAVWNPPLSESQVPPRVTETQVREKRRKAAEPLSCDGPTTIANPVKDESAGFDQQSVPGTQEDPHRKSAIFETALLLSALVRLGVKTLAFCRTRKLTELVLRYTKEELKFGYKGKAYPKTHVQRFDLDTTFRSGRPHLADKVAGYRGGYQLAERRIIEKKMFAGQLLAVTATCALELGIDLGHLDVVLLLGYPGSAASMWQQIGRAGRSGKDALSLQVCFDGGVDQYFARSPHELLDRSRVEDALFDPVNKYIIKDHLLCALRERPLIISKEDSDELAMFAQGDSHSDDYRSKVVEEALTSLVQDKLVTLVTQKNGTKIYQTHSKLTRPHNNVSLRTIDPIVFELYHGSDLLDSIPYRRCFFEVYPGAIYMHQGKSFLVTKMDLDSKRAYAQPTKVRYYTQPRDHVNVIVTKRLGTKRVGSLEVHCGSVNIVAVVWGYRKLWFRSGRVFEMHEFTLPPMQFETQAIWIDISEKIQALVKEKSLNLTAGLHALNHLLTTFVGLYIICAPQSVDTEHVSFF